MAKKPKAKKTDSNGASNGSLKKSLTAKKTSNKPMPDEGGNQHRTLEDLLEEGVKDMYSAETQLLSVLPHFISGSSSLDLKDAFTKHLRQTRRHIDRLDKIFDKLKIDASNFEKCEAMEGLIEEGQKIIGEYGESPVRDSALIICAQKIEHYGIASYGSLCELSDVLGYYNICDMLGKTLDDDERTDQDFTDIAMYVNDEAHSLSENIHSKIKK